MREQVYDFDKTLIQTLLDYQNSYYKLGTEYGEVIWYKLYSKEYIEDGMRKLYDARWIDYEKQLKNGTIIYDEYSINGIFLSYESIVFLMHMDVKPSDLSGVQIMCAMYKGGCLYYQ